MTRRINAVSLIVVFFILILLPLVFACGGKGTHYEMNLLKNGSFEDYEGKLPDGWKLDIFRGIKGADEVEYGIDASVTSHGETSFYFKGDENTGLWYALSQEVQVKDITHIRLRGAIRTEDVRRMQKQYSQSNFLLTFYDENHNRFQDMRFADKRTKPRVGTQNWVIENHTFRIPKNTAYIKVSCILGMTGTVWFDDLALEIPMPRPWNSSQTKNFDFYWLAERPFPSGAMEQQQLLYDDYCRELGVTDDQRISYYLYPDSAAIQEILSLKGVFYVSWIDREIHTIHPYEDHEIIHIILEPYGVPPRSICEGTVYYLQGGYLGQPVHPIARKYLADKRLPSLLELLNYNQFALLPSYESLPAISSYVSYIVETEGMDKLIELYQASGGTNVYDTFGKAFERVYGFSLADSEVRWKQYLMRGEFPGIDTIPTPPSSDEGN